MSPKADSRSRDVSLQFRPKPKLPPRLGQTFEEYEIYLKSYDLYVKSLKADRDAFWKEVECKRQRKPFELPVVTFPPVSGNTAPRYNVFLKQFPETPFVPETFGSEAECIQFLKTIGSSYMPSKMVIKKQAQSAPRFVAVQMTPVVPKPLAPQPTAQPLSEAQLASKKATVAARRRRHRAARRSRRLAQEAQQAKLATEATRAKFDLVKVQTKLDEWTLVTNKRQKKKSLASSSPPATRPAWYPTTQEDAVKLRNRWDKVAK